jgi:hypothetical protein
MLLEGQQDMRAALGFAPAAVKYLNTGIGYRVWGLVKTK